MANRIQLRRGIKSRIPSSLAEGEPAYTTDTYELFVGTGGGNVNMNGSKWYTGTDMSAASGSNNSYNGCPLVKVGDMYLNTSYGYVYECTTAGSGSSAKWTYKGCIKGAQGTTGAKGDKGDHGANATIVIAASDSLTKSKAAADYVCTGSGDQSTITAALSVLPSTGGKIVFLEGTYNISSAFTINKNIVFEGMGDGTQFNVSGSLATCSSAVNVVLRDMKITANTISKYLYKGGGSDNVLLDNVTLTMTATGAHALSTTDAYAAFIGGNSFIADKSRISLTTSCTFGTSNCFSIAEYKNTTNQGKWICRISNCHIKLNSGNGNTHISRNGLDMVNSVLDLTNSTNGAADVAYVDWLINSGANAFGCEIHLSGVSGNASFAGFGTVVGSRFIKNASSPSVTVSVKTAVGCVFGEGITSRPTTELGNIN